MGICFSAELLSHWSFFPPYSVRISLTVTWCRCNYHISLMQQQPHSKAAKPHAPLLSFLNHLPRQCKPLEIHCAETSCLSRTGWLYVTGKSHIDRMHRNTLRQVPREHPKAYLQQGTWGRQTQPWDGTCFLSPFENPLGSLAGSLLGKTQHYFISKRLERSAFLWLLQLQLFIKLFFTYCSYFPLLSFTATTASWILVMPTLWMLDLHVREKIHGWMDGK